MKINDLSREVAQDTGVSIAISEQVIKSALEIIKNTVAAGEDVKLHMFGNFERAERAERNGRNPTTGEDLVIPACFAPRFRASKDFKHAVNS